ncbi:oligosaccharide flippase family protein, partial [Methanobacterium sp.]|uniref:oligosaccharide flippase family protein n=1 Tax=Methanobacterium sp. TaxID=2164 RepID=UPI003C76F5F8
MSTTKRIAKNTGVLFISQVISYLLIFFYTIYIARSLGTEGFGTLSFALAFSGIFSIFADLGINTLTVREVARDKSLSNKYLGNGIIIKILLGFFSFGLIILIINLLGYN